MADPIEQNSNQLTTIVIPCRTIEDFTHRCIVECQRVCEGAKIFVVPDEQPLQWPYGEEVQVIASGPCNPSKKRNSAAQAAATQYLGFIDDDAYPEQGWLENGVHILNQEPEIGSVGGPNISPPNQSMTRRIVGNAARSFLVAGPFTYRKRIARARDCEHLSSCNLVMRRRDYLQVGGMDESLFTGDDTSLSARLQKAGFRLRYSPDVVVYHSDRTLRGAFFQRIASGFDIFKEWRTTGLSEYFFYTLPMMFILFLILGALFLYFPVARWFYFGTIATYLGGCSFESLRTSKSLLEIPGTFVAILIGNLGPGVGSLCKLLGVPLNLYHIYRIKNQPQLIDENQK